MGDFAEQFVAVEVEKLEHMTGAPPASNASEARALASLCSNIKRELDHIVGPTMAALIVQRIKSDIETMGDD